jgi:hypothetical protein
LPLLLGATAGKSIFHKQGEIKAIQVEDHQITAIALEAFVISFFIGGGYLFALLASQENPYWVPTSTAAIIMQGATFRAIWHRNVHRIVGTTSGMAIAWLIFSLSPGFLVTGSSNFGTELYHRDSDNSKLRISRHVYYSANGNIC